MFKKTKLAAASAVVLGLSSMTAQAVSVNHAGSGGEVLIYPYYNVNNDFTSLFNIVNTTNDYKAVKVRFRESKKSNDLLDFNLYMSPHDVFTMNLTFDEVNNVVLLRTTDKSCTQPAIKAEGEGLRSAYIEVEVPDTMEGYLEVIEMGVVSTTATVENAKGQQQLIASEGLLHDSTGVPKDCGVINLAWKQGVFNQGGASSNTRTIDMMDPASDNPYPRQRVDSELGYYGQRYVNSLHRPTGGLVGTSIFVDVPNGVGYVAEPVSIVNYSTRAQHYLSSDSNFYLLPSLASGNIQTAEHTAYRPGVVGGTLVNGVFDAYQNGYSLVVRDYGLDDRSTTLKNGRKLKVPSGVNPLPMADAMLVDSLTNQYFLGSTVTTTDWVVSQPMKKHGIYNGHRYVPTSAGYDFNTDTAVDFYGTPTSSTVASHGYWEKFQTNDVISAFAYYDREEQTPVEPPSPDDFSPPLPIDVPEFNLTFNREVRVVSFHTDAGNASVLGSVNQQAYELKYSNGWGSFNFDKDRYNLDETISGSRYQYWYTSNLYRDNNGDASVTGVPLHGFMASKFILGDDSVGETIPHAVGKKR